jgi:hypothetical protein
MKTLSRFQGRRIPNPPKSWEAGECPYQNGDYWKDDDGTWYGATPNGLLAWLKNHHVEEHEDGTISVVSGSWGTNSILVNGDRPNRWHGAIEKGVWKEF